MIKYYKNFRKGSINGANGSVINESLFTSMIEKTGNKFEESSWEKDSSLPTASFLTNNELHIMVYNHGSRNMKLLSRTNKFLLYMLRGIQLIFHVYVDCRANSVKTQIALFKFLGAKFINHTEHNFDSDMPITLQEIISSKGNTNGIEIQKNTIILNKPNDKNWKLALLICLYGFKKGLNWNIKFLAEVKEKDFQKLLGLIWSKDNKFYGLGDNISISKEVKPISDLFFDNKINKTIQKDEEVVYSRNKNLYKDHNDLLEKVATYYYELGYQYTTEKLDMDLFVEKNGKYKIIEVKGKPTRKNIFLAISQLTFYKMILVEKFNLKSSDIELEICSKKGIDKNMEKFARYNSIEFRGY